MSIDTLGMLFNSPARVKIMRLFLLNPKSVFTPSLIVSRSSVSATIVRREVAILARAGFISRKKERRAGKRPLDGWTFNTKFEYTDPLKNLLLGAEFIDPSELGKKFRRLGKVRGLVLSGIFNHDQKARLDVLVIGDNLKRPAIERLMRTLEAEIGKELSYAAFDTAEFMYRASMYDKLIRDVIDFPHQKIINVGGLLEQVPKLTS